MKVIFLIITLLFLSSCAPKDAPDPLKNSKKLIIKGHTSLYNNGILEIPYTKIKLISAVSNTTNLSHKLFFKDARAALQKGLKDALESVYIIPKGTKKAYEFSKGVYRVSNDISDDIRKYTNENGTFLIYKSSTIAKEHILNSFSTGYQTGKTTFKLGESIENYFDIASSDILDSHWSRSKQTLNSSINLAGEINRVSTQWAEEDFKFGVNAFVTGYITLPQKLDKSLNAMRESLTGSHFTKAYDSAGETREDSSIYFTDIISDTFSKYTKNSSESFSKASKNFTKNVENEGLALTSVKSMRWLLQAIFYDGLIMPISKLTFGTIGFISVNGVIYPINVLSGQTKASTMVLIEVTKETASSAYEILAPSMTFAFASVLSSTEYLGGKTLAGATVIAGATTSAIDASSGVTISSASKVSGIIAGNGVKYIGVPLAVSVRTTGEISYGVLASTTSAVAGSGILLVGESTALSTQTTGSIIAGGTLIAGTTYSVASAASQGIYHLSEAGVLPAGYTLASGTVLGYGGISQLQAHTLLAASDAAYIVLSLEGAKWVLYTLSGDSIKDEKALPVGAVIDLKKMHENNETIKRMEVSDKEMEKILESLDKDLSYY